MKHPNTKTYRIIQYIQPWEIDDLERQATSIIISSYYFPPHAEVIWDVTLNLDIVNWNNSKIPSDFFVNKLNYLETIVGYYLKAEFNVDSKIKGCTDKRRNIINTAQDYVIWLDSDVFFPKTTLPSLLNSTQFIKDDIFMVSPQIIKYWDNSWDCLVNSRFINGPYNHRDNFDLYSLDNIDDDITIKLNNIVKFGGGWFNLFSNEVFDKIKFPDELGSYSTDDLYVMLCSRKLDFKQYILDGVVVSEIGNKYLINKNYIKPLLDIKISDKQKISDYEFNNLIKKFYEKH
jgi:hypothetical protein